LLTHNYLGRGAGLLGRGEGRLGRGAEGATLGRGDGLTEGRGADGRGEGRLGRGAEGATLGRGDGLTEGRGADGRGVGTLGRGADGVTEGRGATEGRGLGTLGRGADGLGVTAGLGTDGLGEFGFTRLGTVAFVLGLVPGLVVGFAPETVFGRVGSREGTLSPLPTVTRDGTELETPGRGFDDEAPGVRGSEADGLATTRFVTPGAALGNALET
jgi:hypothetical protein